MKYNVTEADNGTDVQYSKYFLNELKLFRYFYYTFTSEFTTMQYTNGALLIAISDSSGNTEIHHANYSTGEISNRYKMNQNLNSFFFTIMTSDIIIGYYFDSSAAIGFKYKFSTPNLSCLTISPNK